MILNVRILCGFNVELYMTRNVGIYDYEYRSLQCYECRSCNATNVAGEDERALRHCHMSRFHDNAEFPDMPEFLG